MPYAKIFVSREPLLVGSPLVGSPLVGSPLVGSPLVGSPLVALSLARDLVSRDLVSRDLVSRDLVSRDLVSRDLVSRDLVSRDLVSSLGNSAASIGSIYRQRLSAASIGSVYRQRLWCIAKSLGPRNIGSFRPFSAIHVAVHKIDGDKSWGREQGPKDLEGQPLTRRQELFVKELVSQDGQITLRQAAINAGYSTGSAHQRAYELTNPNICPHVVKQIKIYRDELDHKYGIDYKRHIRDLQVIRDRALENGAYSAAVQAEYRRGQAHGDIYINKSEIRHGSIDSMSKEDVLKALNEIKDGYAQNTIDVTPEREADSGDIPEQGERVVEDDEVSLGEEPEEV
jgi:hypothetical protein